MHSGTQGLSYFSPGGKQNYGGVGEVPAPTFPIKYKTIAIPHILKPGSFTFSFKTKNLLPPF